MKTETCEILAKHRKRRHPPQAHYHTTYFQVQVKIMKNKTVNIILYQTLISKKDQKKKSEENNQYQHYKFGVPNNQKIGPSLVSTSASIVVAY